MSTSTGRSELARQVGGRIRERRVAIGMTEEELAGRLDRRKEVIQAYEEGVELPTAMEMLKIADVLAVKLAWLFGNAR